MSCRSSHVSCAPARHTLAALALLLIPALPARAQSHETASTATLTNGVVALAAEHAVPPAESRHTDFTSTNRRVLTPIEPERPPLLVPLYVSFGVLQAMDAHSTFVALGSGAREQNPIVSPFARNPAALVTMKAATTLGTIVLAEALRRRHPVKAMVMMAVVNVAYGAIVAANYRK